MIGFIDKDITKDWSSNTAPNCYLIQKHRILVIS